MLDNLRKAREEQHLTQKQLGEMLDMRQQDIQRYERGKVEPSIDTLKKMSLVLNKSIDYLVGVEGASPDGKILLDGKALTSREIKNVLLYRVLSRKLKKDCDTVIDNFSKIDK